MINDIAILVNEKFKIIDNCVEYIRKEFPYRTTEYDKCFRDLNYIINAFVHDLNDDSTSNTIYIGNKFWIRDQLQITDKSVEIKVYNRMIEYIDKNYSLSTEFILKITNLKNILCTIIDKGPIEESTSWQRDASLRFNTYNWKDDVPSKEMIEDIINDLHNYSPSKQKIVRYKIEVYRNNNEEKRNKIYRAHATSKKDDAIHNPQVLAPWLLFFKRRIEAKDQDKFRESDFYIDLGIAISHIIYSATSKGLDTGLSRCINYPELIIDAIGYHPEMTIGIGYKDPATEYYCPHYKKIVRIHGQDEPKPAIEKYVKYV